MGDFIQASSHVHLKMNCLLLVFFIFHTSYKNTAWVFFIYAVIQGDLNLSRLCAISGTVHFAKFSKSKMLYILLTLLP